jgi:hypothetical protein
MEFDIKGFHYYIRTIDGQRFLTLHRKMEFEVNSSLSGLIYVPKSTGKPRHHPWKFIERVVKRYSEIVSLHPGDYRDISANASYLLTLIDSFLNQRVN